MSYKDYRDSIEICVSSSPYYSIIHALQKECKEGSEAVTIALMLRGRYDPYALTMAEPLIERKFSKNALIMAAMREADTDNHAILLREWPLVWAELKDRYRTPGGLLNGEENEVHQ